MRQIIMAGVLLCSAALAAPVAAAAAAAQQTTGIVTGRVVDAQGSAVPGVTVTGRNAHTGFTRTDHPTAGSTASGIARRIVRSRRNQGLCNDQRLDSS